MPLEISCVMRPGIGETDCRGRCGWWVTPNRIVMALAEGVGNGPEAAYAADLALACIGAGLDRPFVELFAACDARLWNTRGVSLAIAVVEQATGLATLGSVGNVRSVVLNENRTGLGNEVSGAIGIGYTQLKHVTIVLEPGKVIALSSSGLDEFLKAGEILAKDDICARDFAGDIVNRWLRSRDDVALLIYRHRKSALHKLAAVMPN
jgi:hypothetical protein